MKKLEINELDSSTVNVIAEALEGNDQGLLIRFGEIACCPHLIVPIYALIDHYRSLGAKVEVAYNEHAEVGSVFRKGDFGRPFGSIWRFDSEDTLLDIFNATQKEILKLPNIGKGFKTAFGWCLSEVMDNTLQHSQEKRGKTPIGYMMIQYVHSERLLKCCVFDLGIGLYESFIGTKYNPKSPLEAIELAVQPNVTSGNGQGNGLYGLKEIVKQSNHGRLEIKSAGARYLLEKGREFSGSTQSIIGFTGTTSVDFQMYFENTFSIDTIFPDYVASSDLWMEDHEVGDDAIRLNVLEIVKGTVSRDFGKEMRNTVENVIENEHKRVIIDFSGVEMCSSAFVDELVGKLVERYQFVLFSRFVDFANVSGLTALLINHSIRQRLAEKRDAIEVNDSYGRTELGQTGPAQCFCAQPVGEEMATEGSVVVEGR